MFEEQIKSLAVREARLIGELDGIEESKKQKKAELAVVRKAKRQMEKLETDLASGQIIEDEPELAQSPGEQHDTPQPAVLA